MFEIIQKEADEFAGLGERYDVPPVWARDGTRVGGYEKLNQIAESPAGYKKLNALLSGMPNGTCQSYLRGWKHWAQYCSLRGYEPWVEVGGPGWGEMLLDFIMFENSVLCLKPSTTAGKICAIRYFHIIHGRQDFTTAGVRYKMLLKSLTKKQPSVQKLPFNVDLVQWLWGKIHTLGQWTTKVQEMWAGLNLGFFFLLRASEIKQVRQKDIEISVENGQRKLTLFIYKSKTDQSQRGCFRTLVGNNTELCPARAMVRYLGSFDWDCESDEKVFSGDVELRIRSMIKRIATPNGLEAKRFSTHSLRSGGATAMYVRGISAEHIRRFGRWASDTFRRYLYRGNQVFKFVGNATIKATGLLDQLQMTQADTENVHFGGDDVEEEGDDRYRVGGTGNPRRSSRPSPTTVEVNWTASEDEEPNEGSTNTPGLPPTLVLRPRSNVSSGTSDDERHGTEGVATQCVLALQNSVVDNTDGEMSPWSRIQPVICSPGREESSNHVDESEKKIPLARLQHLTSVMIFRG